MLVFILRRLGSGIVLLFVVATATFFLLSLTGQDPARQILGPAASVEQVEAKRAELGLDQPVPRPIRPVARRRGPSATWASPGTRTSQSPRPVALSPFRPPCRWFSARSCSQSSSELPSVSSPRFAEAPSTADLQVVSTFVQAVPGFLVALFLALIFAVQLGLFPATGYTSLTTHPVIGSPPSRYRSLRSRSARSPSIALQIRGSMIDVLRQDYVRTLRSRGLPDRSVLLKHALRSAAGPTLTTRVTDVHRVDLRISDRGEGVQHPRHRHAGEHLREPRRPPHCAWCRCGHRHSGRDRESPGGSRPGLGQPEGSCLMTADLVTGVNESLDVVDDGVRRHGVLRRTLREPAALVSAHLPRPGSRSPRSSPRC